MSVINQMLRDIDARAAAASGESPVAPGARAAKLRRSGMRTAVLLVLLSAGGGAGYLALSATSYEPRPPAPAEIARHRTASPPTTAVPAVHAEQKAGQTPSPVRPAVAPAAPQAPAPPADRARGTLAAHPLAIQDASAAVPAVQTGPAVVKKTAELSPEADAQAFIDDAQALRRSGKVDAAIGKYRQALERDPGMRNARIQLAALLQESGQADAALSVLKTGYAQQPDDRLAIAAGRLLADQGQGEEALNWLARAREGMRPAEHALMGALLLQTQAYEEAVREYQRALAADPRQGGWLLGLGLALEALGRADEARMAYRDALERGEFKPDVIRFLRQKTAAPDR